jgi:hypothetical protein
MKGLSLIAAALLVYVIVALLAVSSPSHGPASADAVVAQPIAASGQAAHLKGLPYRGLAMQLQRVDWIDKYEKSIDEIAALGGDTVSLVVDARQENGQSTDIYVDMRKTPTVPQLSEIILHAKAKKIRVVLMPIILLDDPVNNEWRGTIKPPDWDHWFDSYRDVMEHFARIAQATGVDVFVVGSELVSTERNVDQWTRTIRSIRSIFKGQLTYSSNWDHYTVITFWNQLDLIGMNSYWALGDDHNATVDQIIAHWKKIQKDLIPFVQKEGRPLILLEAGWCSLANAASASWDYTQATEPIDLALQKRLYEGFFQSWYGNPNMGGFIMWDWPPTDGGPDDRGYTPKNKPAEQVLHDWLAKPAWTVN